MSPLNIDLRAMVIPDHGEPTTTSFQVAEAFGKRHDNVIRKIESLECSEEFTRLNFEVCYQNNDLQNGKPQKLYRMTKDGFMFLVMGFSGKEAARIKEAYINAFNWMAHQLTETGYALAKRYNYLTLKYQHGKEDASSCGRGLNAWRLDKVPMENELDRLKNQLQGQLQFEQSV